MVNCTVLSDEISTASITNCGNTPRGKSGRRWIHWDKEDTILITQYFKEFICDQKCVNLCQEMKSFLSLHEPKTLFGFPLAKQIDYLRTKLNNERMSQRKRKSIC